MLAFSHQRQCAPPSPPHLASLHLSQLYLCLATATSDGQNTTRSLTSPGSGPGTAGWAPVRICTTCHWVTCSRCLLILCAVLRTMKSHDATPNCPIWTTRRYAAFPSPHPAPKRASLQRRLASLLLNHRLAVPVVPDSDPVLPVPCS